jgi:pimeloyl-ACP methyl ester carboxylesterase
VNDVTLLSERFGERADPAILLIMGAMASGVWWPEDFCRQLASRGRHVIRYDHRDTGKSTSYPPGHLAYGVEDLADDAVRVLDAYGIQRAHLVGMSLGGYLAQLIGLKYEERVHTLTLIAAEALEVPDPQIPGIDPAVLAYHAGAARLDWRDRAAVIEYQVGAWRLLSGSAHPFEEGEIRALAAADFDKTPNPASAFNHAALAEPVGWLGRLSQLRSPVLVIHGTEDRVVPYAHALTIKARVAAATLLALQGTGHELHRADWPVILNAIEEHTSRVPADPAEPIAHRRFVMHFSTTPRRCPTCLA